ncbi:hypothetical protein FKP32DRAFT_800841 [Trametes sanguinea]|nr:hypothetical protein FKP32DRAFT_800841 [Trametes sanguinea]
MPAAPAVSNIRHVSFYLHIELLAGRDDGDLSRTMRKRSGTRVGEWLEGDAWRPSISLCARARTYGDQCETYAAHLCASRVESATGHGERDHEHSGRTPPSVAQIIHDDANRSGFSRFLRGSLLEHVLKQRWGGFAVSQGDMLELCCHWRCVLAHAAFFARALAVSGATTHRYCISAI